MLMSFQTIYSINYRGSEHSRPLLDQNFEKFIAPPPLQYIENFQSLSVLSLITNNLSWSNQVTSSVKKANRILGLVKRTVGLSIPTSTFAMLYKAFVKPLLEYAVQVWSRQS